MKPEAPPPGRPSRIHDPDAEYFQTVEEFFVSRRGDPLFLSNPDWLLVQGWRRAGVPLRVVLRGIADALDSHAHSWGRDRKVGSLAYCRHEVEAAWERWERALRLGAQEGVDSHGFLLGLAESLESARGLGPRAAELAARIAEQIRARAEEPGAARELEPWLLARESSLVRALAEDMGREAWAGLEAGVDEVLRPYRGRLPPKVVEQVRKESLARHALEGASLPRLSLFTLET